MTTTATAIPKSKIKSAITTDFVLSVEIVIISLGTVLGEELADTDRYRFGGFGSGHYRCIWRSVALIVRMDDAGYQLD